MAFAIDMACCLRPLMAPPHAMDLIVLSCTSGATAPQVHTPGAETDPWSDKPEWILAIKG
jgi:hypothetical protein